jgi:N-acetylmuramic acid 6-phosphate etherase
MPPMTEHASPRYDGLDAWDPPSVLEALWQGQLAAVAAVGPALPAIAEAATAAAARLAAGGRLAYVGAGSSGRIGVQDGSELAPTFDWPEDRLILLMAGGASAFTQAVENAEDQDGEGRADIAAHGIGPADVVVGLAASGTTPYTVAAIDEAARRGALTVAIANNPATPLLAAARHPILVVTGAEPVAGSTRLQAGTAQKVVLNLFSTLVMIRLGRVYRGRMVDMLARNDKLRRRGERMLRDLTNCDAEAARAALAVAGGKVKLAVLILGGMTREIAQARLAAHGGNLRAVIEENRR